MSEKEPASKAVRWPILGCVAAALLIGLMCAGVRVWLAAPRVKVADVEQRIGTSLPLGTSKKVVEEWLAAHSMVIQDYTDSFEDPCIQSWIPDSGPRAELPFGIRDIRIRFFFDKNERLTRVTVQEEDRF
jgi:hypothetical protein